MFRRVIAYLFPPLFLRDPWRAVGLVGPDPAEAWLDLRAWALAAMRDER